MPIIVIESPQSAACPVSSDPVVHFPTLPPSAFEPLEYFTCSLQGRPLGRSKPFPAARYYPAAGAPSLPLTGAPSRRGGSFRQAREFV